MKSPDSKAPLPDQGERAPALASTRQIPSKLSTLKKRSEFLACARARRAHAPGMVVQGRQRGTADLAEPVVRVGYTCSKKVGKAVIRNRAKRRLREAARVVLPELGRGGWDYVLVGRAEVTVSRRFADLVRDLEAALGKLHGAGR